MTRRADPTEMMWAQAVDFLEQADRLHRQFFRLVTSPRAEAQWEPPADVFEDDHEVVIAVAMPGVSADRIEVGVEPGQIVVRGERPLPFVGTRYAVRQMEIPSGCFERRIALPPGVFEPVGRELTHGCLVLRLRRIG
jgi:HSP20 family molecular chaperone IbpA